jgi:hypothetical protein
MHYFKILLKVLAFVFLSLFLIAYIIIIIKFFINLYNGKVKENEAIERIMPLEAINGMFRGVWIWIFT